MTLAPSVYGPLDDDIALLASDGKVIRRHDGMYRLNGAIEKLTAAQVRGMAAELRNRRLAVRYAPAMKAGHEIASDRGPDDPRARMARHEITERGKGRPPGGRAGTPVEGRAGSSPAAPTCTKCGGPRSKESKGLCVGCYTPKGCPPNPKPPTAERPDKFWRAVESAQLTSQSHHVRDVTKMVGPDQSVVTSKMLNSDAAPDGRVDVVYTDIPPAATPQTASGPGGFAVTPAPEYGASAGTIPAGDTGNAGGSHDTLTPAPEVARPATPAASCPCGRPRGHGGRCWHKRGLDGPAEKRARWKHPPKVCEKCGGPRSYWSAACCLKCHRTAMSAPRVTQENRIQALERKVAALEALMSMEGLR